MKTVFVSGSRAIGRLNEAVRDRLRNVMRQSFQVILGDANGADKAVQSFLHESGYRQVEIFSSGGRCRNNVGAWPVRAVAVAKGVAGRDFYTAKDRKMAAEADFGMVLWDGKSPGSLENIVELANQEKPVLVYLAPHQAFHTVTTVDTLRRLLADCNVADLEQISRKTGLILPTGPESIPRQEALAF